MTVFLDAPRSGQVLFGVSGPFKRNMSIDGKRKRRNGNVIHLGTAKTELATVTADFVAMNSGVVLDAGEFDYISNNGLLGIVNLDVVNGIEADASVVRSATRLGQIAVPFGQRVPFHSHYLASEIPLSKDTAIDSTVVITTIESPMITG